jgi:8-oxo-dGTP pyrophosphatase MutT (NUDIX family)
VEPLPSLAGARLADRIRGVLAGRAKRAVEMPERVAAAVLLMVFERDGEPWIVLTKRTQHVRSHKGEISFPGGVRDPADSTLEQTAVREAVEELGVDPSVIEIVGELDDLPTFSSGYVVSPFVAVVQPVATYSPSPAEIDEVIEVPVAELARVGRAAVWDRGGRQVPTHVFETGGHVVWGATGRILRDFLDVVGPALVP